MVNNVFSTHFRAVDIDTITELPQNKRTYNTVLRSSQYISKKHYQRSRTLQLDVLSR